MRTRVRRDLHDEDPENQRWTDDELDRHIERAVRELSLAIPLEAKATLDTSEGSRDISLASLSDLVAVEAVEYPVDKYPPSYIPFSLWAGTLTLLMDATPPGGQSVNIYYGEMHTLDATTSTIAPPWRNWWPPGPPPTLLWSGPASPPIASTWAGRTSGATT